MNGYPCAFRARLAHFNFSLILNSVILVTCLSASAPAQDLDEVSFSGVVTDQHGAVVPGAAVTARLAGAKVERDLVGGARSNEADCSGPA